ncbi:PepSY-like domain-containing protein [Chitinophagaceae bacterium LB-8]|jgi:putative PepSY-like beta-lactamase-inhibitor|uniref:PepSY-like domain-containing protein n=1 Tax=Paraflavisolibacter caeni TaxID=2982496 RepID=A0A9X2XTD9_9BACT|nr:PepSY-like domain-containing protein [Paraflavisolibacter caeni]MCU7548460.1 PepSY-like domain-containing protein [Paraflavisolibacter caeni]
MMRRIFSLLLLLFLLNAVSFGQIREVPEAVQEAFDHQYPDADSVKYEDNFVSVQVHFTLNGERMKASYTNKGRWKETEKVWNFEQLPADVKDGFDKSKYADWQISETKIVYRPDGVERYRVKVGKNDLQKKYLFFNKTGRLVEELITI